MKTILVATDFSQASANAAKYAASMALAIKADIVLLNVYQMPVSYTEMPVLVNQDEMLEDAKLSLVALKDQLDIQAKHKLRISIEVKTGSFFEELQLICATIKPYSVIMGSQGTSASERLLFGGHVVYAMKHLEWPIITIPLKASYGSIKKMGLACNFENEINLIPVDEIEKMVNDLHATLHILNTGKMGEFDPEIIYHAGQLEQKLGQLKPVFHFLTVKNTDEGIIDFAEKNEIDLLIVLPERHGLFDMLIHKSHTKQFVLHSHVPVMALHHQV